MVTDVSAQRRSAAKPGKAAAKLIAAKENTRNTKNEIPCSALQSVKVVHF
jgi:hypothetical protein